MNKTPLAPEVLHLASNLFGLESRKQTSPEKTVATAAPETIMAVYPAIIEEAFAKTMDNYRKHAALKNFMCIEENDRIAEHNKIVRKYRKENKEMLATVQIDSHFINDKQNKALNPTEYNLKAEECCKKYGMIVQKRKLITLKYSTELVVQNLLCLYNQQLSIKNNRFISCGITHKTPLEEFKLNSWKVTQLKRNGIKSLNVCPKTVRNHIARLREFEVLTDYHFAGRNRAIEVRFNPEILVVKDIYNSKLTRLENQRVTPEKGKIVPDDNVKLTGTSINELKRNGKVNYSQDDKEFAPLMPFNLSFTRTPTNSAENISPGREKIVKVADDLLQTIIHDQELAENLATCQYNNYCPIDIRLLYSQANAGFITREEFFDIAMVDFFKTLQKNIYRKGNVYVGSWKIAINLFRKQRWRRWDHEINRQDVQWARKWFVKNHMVNPLFPHHYLDVTRKTAKSVGFEYTREKWKEHVDGLAAYDAKVKKQEIDAGHRKTAASCARKLEAKLNAFFKDKLTLTQLFDYVKNNLPPEYSERLPDMIEKKFLKINEKVVYQTDVANYRLDEF